MDEATEMKNLAKKYLDTADEKTIKMVLAMLEVDAEKDWGMICLTMQKNQLNADCKI